MFEEIKNKNLDNALQIFEDIYNQDYSISDLIIYMNKILEKYNDIEYKIKFEYMKIMA